MAGARASICSASPVASPALVLLLFIVFFLSIATPVKAWRPWQHLGSNSSSSLGESKKYEGSSEFVQLRYHMGPVLTANITVHPIWYGQWAPAQKRIIRAFLRSISPVGTTVRRPSVAAWWRTVAMYTDQTGANVSRAVRLGAEKNDRRYSHGRSLTRLSIQHVIRSAVTARTRPLPVNPRGGLYLLLTSAEVAVEDFCGQVCGFHYFTFPSIVGYTLPYAWIGNAERACPGVCSWPFAVPEGYGGPRAGAPPNGEVGVDAMVSVIGHELAEMASNPLVNAWYAGADPCFPTEIADLCEGIYGTGGGGSYTGQLTVDERDGAAYNLNGVGGRRFLVQWVWHPDLNYCYGPNALD